MTSNDTEDRDASPAARELYGQLSRIDRSVVDSLRSLGHSLAGAITAATAPTAAQGRLTPPTEGHRPMKWHIPYDGRDWEFDDSHVTASEARAQKRITEGMGPVAADTARLELDPDAWIAALVIARRRAGLPDEQAQAVDADLLELADIFENTRAVMEANAAAEKARRVSTSDTPSAPVGPSPGDAATPAT